MRTRKAVMRYLPVFFLLLFAAANTGCASKGQIGMWQKNLAEYVSEQGDGDPSVLRNTVNMHSRGMLRPARVTFGGRFSGPKSLLSKNERDISGILLGQEEIGSRHWYLFLVGVKDRSNKELEDVRLVGFTPDKTKLRWRVADPDPEAVEKYLAALQSSGQRLAPGRFYADTFPFLMDEYSLAVSGYVVTVTERHSGAVWELNLQD